MDSDHDTATRDLGASMAASDGYTALVIPACGPITELALDNEDNLAALQSAVGGWIEAVGIPEFIDPTGHSTAYVNEEGKYTPECVYNPRATDFMVPGVGLMWGDFISGTLVLCGFDPDTGEHAELPKSVVDRVRLIEREAGPSEPNDEEVRA